MSGRPSQIERYRGCLLGLAVGDARRRGVLRTLPQEIATWHTTTSSPAHTSTTTMSVARRALRSSRGREHASSTVAARFRRAPHRNTLAEPVVIGMFLQDRDTKPRSFLPVFTNAMESCFLRNHLQNLRYPVAVRSLQTAPRYPQGLCITFDVLPINPRKKRVDPTRLELVTSAMRGRHDTLLGSSRACKIAAN